MLRAGFFHPTVARMRAPIHDFSRLFWAFSFSSLRFFPAFLRIKRTHIHTHTHMHARSTALYIFSLPPFIFSKNAQFPLFFFFLLAFSQIMKPRKATLYLNLWYTSVLEKFHKQYNKQNKNCCKLLELVQCISFEIHFISDSSPFPRTKFYISLQKNFIISFSFKKKDLKNFEIAKEEGAY